MLSFVKKFFCVKIFRGLFVSSLLLFLVFVLLFVGTFAESIYSAKKRMEYKCPLLICPESAKESSPDKIRAIVGDLDLMRSWNQMSKVGKNGHLYASWGRVKKIGVKFKF